MRLIDTDKSSRRRVCWELGALAVLNFVTAAQLIVTSGSRTLSREETEWLILGTFASAIPALSTVLLLFRAISSRALARRAVGASCHVSRPPGTCLAAVAEFLSSRRTWEGTFKTLIADLQLEYFDALAAGRPWRARWIRVRYMWAFIKTAGVHTVLRVVAQAWRAMSGG